MANPPPGFPGETGPPAAAETTSVGGPGHWLLRCLEQVPAFPSLPIYLCPLASCVLGLFLRELGSLTPLPAQTAGLPLLCCVFLRPHHVSLRYQLIPPPPNTLCALQPSSRSHCLLSLFSLVSELSGKESRAPASPVLCCCFSLSRYGQGPRARAKEGREEGRQREKEGARGGGTEEARKARRQSVQGSGVRKAWGRNAVGKEDRGPCAKKEFGGNTRERFSIGPFINNATAADSNLPRKARNPPSA